MPSDTSRTPGAGLGAMPKLSIGKAVPRPIWQGSVPPEDRAHFASWQVLGARSTIELGRDDSASFLVVLTGSANLAFQELEVRMGRYEWVSHQGEAFDVMPVEGSLVLMLTVTRRTYEWLQGSSKPGFTIGRGKVQAAWLRKAGQLLRTAVQGGLKACEEIDVVRNTALLAHIAQPMFEGVRFADIPGRNHRSKRQCLTAARRAWFVIEHSWDVLRTPSIAKYVGLSSWHLSKIFHQVYGEDLRTHMRRKRLERAAYLLEATVDTHLVSEVGQEVGYNNPAAFTRAFTLHYGVPPSEARRAFQQRRGGGAEVQLAYGTKYGW